MTDEAPPTMGAGQVVTIVVNYRTPELAVRCLRSLGEERGRVPGLRAVVVDGGSGDGSADHLRDAVSATEFSGWVELICAPVNGGFGWANNQALLKVLNGQHEPEFVHLLNPDTEVHAGAVAALVDELKKNVAVGAAGSQLLEPDGSPTGSAFSFPSPSGEFARGARTGVIDRLLRATPETYDPAEAPMDVDWVTGASVMFRSEALRSSGLFDDGFFLYHEEVELMWRIRARGWRVRHVPASRISHVGGASTGVHSRPTVEKVAPRRPDYWYKSRRRFFVLSRGLFAARLAWLSWLAGHAVWRLRRLLGLSKGAVPVAHEIGDWLSLGWPRRADAEAHVVHAGSPAGTDPAWMSER